MSETSTSSDITPSFTLTDLANRLGVHQRSALRLLNDYAVYLHVPVYTGHRRQLQISSADFERVVELAELLRDRIKRQNRDQLRKQARQVVSTLHESRVQTIAVGDLGDIRNRIDYGPGRTRNFTPGCSVSS